MEASEHRLGSRNVVAVGWLSFFGGISQDVFAPILPIYLTSILGFNRTFVGIAEGVVTASVNLSKVVAGVLSDRFGRQKPLVFLGYFLSMVGRALLALVTGGAAVIGLRLLDGAGKGIKDPPKDVLIAGSSERATRGRSFGIARMLDTLGSVAGPLILFGLLALLKNSSRLYHSILLFSAVPLLITLGLVILRVRELPRSLAPAPNAVQPRPTGRLPRSFFVFLTIVVVFTLGNSSDAFLILRARSLGVTLLEIPLVIALFNAVYALAAVPFGSLSDRIGRVPTLLIGWGAFAAVYLGFALAGHAAWVWALYALYGVYYATSEGVAKALLADTVPLQFRGRAFGIFGTTVGLATLPASFLAGYLWDRVGPSAPFLVGAGTAVVAAILLLAFGRTRTPTEAPAPA